MRGTILEKYSGIACKNIRPDLEEINSETVESLCFWVMEMERDFLFWALLSGSFKNYYYVHALLLIKGKKLKITIMNIPFKNK